jgi:hypothetical protein
MKALILASLTMLMTAAANAEPACPSYVTQGHILPSTIAGACGICEWTCGPQLCSSPMYVATVDGAEISPNQYSMSDARFVLNEAIGQGVCGSVFVR